MTTADAAALQERMERSRRAYEAQKGMNPEFTCHVCMDEGMIDFSTGMVPCYNCEKGKGIERENEQREWIERVNAEVGVPRTTQRDVGRSQFSEGIAGKIQDDIDSHRGTYLYGGVGRGKSVAAAAALLEFVRSVGDVGFSPRYHGVFITSSDYLQSIRDGYGNGTDRLAGTSITRQANSAVSSKLVVLDDIGREYIKSNGGDSWAAEQIGELIDYRTSNGLPTIFTSNLTLAQLERKYNAAAAPMGDRIVSRIQGSCDIIPVTGKDWRKA